MRLVACALTVLLVLSLAGALQAVEKKLYVPPVQGTRQLLDCSNAITIDCPWTGQGSNVGMPNNVDYYSCVGWNEGGGEVVYKLTLVGPDCHIVTGTISGMSADLDIFFLTACDEGMCQAYGNTSFTSECLEPGTYYIVVDGYSGAACSYALAVSCEPCECPVPSCCPSAYHCEVYDFNQSPNGFQVLPCGGAPVWEWGPVTNPDVPSVACDDVPVTKLLGTVLAGDYPVNAGESVVIGPVDLKSCCYCMELCHWYDTESSYDGGNVKISTDGGATWQLIQPCAGYPGATNSYPYCNPDEPAFTGHDLQAGGFVRDCFDLSNFVGQQVLIRFDFGSDSSVQYPGWYIKWVKFGSDQPSPTEEKSWSTIKEFFRRNSRQ